MCEQLHETFILITSRFIRKLGLRMASLNLTENQRLELIVEAVLYCQRVSAMGMPMACYSKALREPIHFLWERRRGTKIQSAKFRSKNALDLKFGKSEMVYDHAVPVRYLQGELLALKEVSTFGLRSILNKYDIFVLITKAEDEMLNSAGFNRSMPDGWKVGDDPLARYNETDIEIVNNPDYLEQI